MFDHLLSFLSNKWLPVILIGKSLQEYVVLFVNTLSPTLFLIHISDLPDIIFNTAIYPDDTTLYSKCDQAQDLWQKPELASGLESDLRDTVA